MTYWLTTRISPDEERAIAAFMTRLADVPLPDASLSGHGSIWWKAQLLRRWDAQRQVARPLTVMEPVQLVAGLAAAALVFFWTLPSVTRALTLMVASFRPII